MDKTKSKAGAFPSLPAQVDLDRQSLGSCRELKSCQRQLSPAVRLALLMNIAAESAIVLDIMSPAVA
jgi:hypothetical protein